MKCACTLCSCTMSHKDLPAHNRGRRHQLALSNADANLRPLPETADIAPAVNRSKDTQESGIVGSSQFTSTAGHLNSHTFNNSADPHAGSSASERVTKSTFSTETVKQKTNKAKRSKEGKHPNSMVESISGPPASISNGYVFHTTPCCSSFFNRETSKKIKLKLLSVTTVNQFPAYRRVTPTRGRDPLLAFFALYAPFKYNRRASSHDEFKRLCAFFGWPSHHIEPNHEERKEAWQSFRIAMVQAFNMTFGHDERDVEAWGRMCVLVDMENIPEGLEARRQVHKTGCRSLFRRRHLSSVLRPLIVLYL